MLDNLNLDLAPTANVANKLIDKISGFLSYKIGKESPENIAVNVFIEEVKKLNCDALTKAMLISKSKTLIREYSNQVNIVKECQLYLKNDARPENIEDDWLHLFMDKARLISNSEVQKLWGKILAGEANKPGSISRQLLNILSYMDKENAENFTNISRFVVEPIYKSGEVGDDRLLLITRKYSDGYYHQHGVSLEGLRSLQSYGLIDVMQNRHFVVHYSYHSEKPIIGICYDKDSMDFLNEKHEIPQGEVIFTKVGQELFNVLSIEPVEDFWEKVVKPFFKEEVTQE